MKVRDEAKWQATLDANPAPSHGEDPKDWPDDMSQDDLGRGYGYTAVLFARRWAEEMERRLSGTALGVGDVAAAAERKVDRELGRWGITGFQYGMAVGLLSVCWERGEELRRWHNLRTQVDDEGQRANDSGGVLNPALLRIRGGGNG